MDSSLPLRRANSGHYVIISLSSLPPGIAHNRIPSPFRMADDAAVAVARHAHTWDRKKNPFAAASSPARRLAKRAQ